MSLLCNEAHALALDAADPLRAFRSEFAFPRHGDDEQIYLCGNSLGLMPHAARDAVSEELDAWAPRAVEGHFHGPRDRKSVGWGKGWVGHEDYGGRRKFK